MNYRQKPAGLLTSVISSPTPYDKTKTYTKGHISQRTINSQLVLGAAPNQIVDHYTDTGGALTGGNAYLSPNGRLFILSTSAGGILTIALYNFNLTTGVRGALVGRIQLNMPNQAATTQTVRAFAVNDTGTTNWTIMLGTVGSVLINGGVFRVNKVDRADFTSSPTVFGMAISSNAKAVYFEQDPSFLGVNNNITAISGGDMDLSDGKFYVETGLLAAMVFYGFDTTVAPTITTQTTTSPTVSGTPTFTLTGHGYNANDPVVMISNTPTGFTQSTSTVMTVYFVRATNLTANTFELSATSGGAAINATSNTASTVFARGFGITTSAFLASKKTGIVTGFSGTILLTNSHSVVTPPAGHPNAGFPCFFLASSTTFHLFKLSDIAAGVTSFPSLATINVLGSGTDITAPTPLQVRYMESIGKIAYTVGTSTLVVKDWVNNAIVNHFAGYSNQWYENTGSTYTGDIGFVALAALESRGGFLLMMGSTAGQRVSIIIDLYSSATFGLSYVTTPVLRIPKSVLKDLGAYRQIPDITVPSKRQFKTSSNYADTIFDNPETGWTDLPNDGDLTGYTLLEYSQFRMLPRIMEKAPYNPAQTSELLIGYLPTYDSSENWSGDMELSTQSSSNPAYSVAYLDIVYQTSVPSITMTAISKSTGLVVRQKNTVTHAAEFEYSTNNGGTWNALGTIPNTVGTRLRYGWGVALPEDVEIIWSET